MAARSWRRRVAGLNFWGAAKDFVGEDGGSEPRIGQQPLAIQPENVQTGDNTEHHLPQVGETGTPGRLDRSVGFSHVRTVYAQLELRATRRVGAVSGAHLWHLHFFLWGPLPQQWKPSARWRLRRVLG